MFSRAKVKVALGGSGVRFGLAESILVFVSIAVATCGCEICIEPCSRRWMCHCKYWAGKPMSDFVFRREGGVYGLDWGSFPEGGIG